MSYDVIFAIVALVLVVVLWPILKWVALILLVLFALLVIKVLIESHKLKKEIQKDPQSYYNNSTTNKDVIDVEYKEKEIVEEK